MVGKYVRSKAYGMDRMKIKVFKVCKYVKVSYSRKQILKFSFEPKMERKYFCISALAFKMGQMIKE